MEKIPKEVRIIETKSIELSDKDVIYIKDWKDFIWLISSVGTLFKLNSCYYILTSEVAYVHEDKK